MKKGVKVSKRHFMITSGEIINDFLFLYVLWEFYVTKIHSQICYQLIRHKYFKVVILPSFFDITFTFRHNFFGSDGTQINLSRPCVVYCNVAYIVRHRVYSPK